MSIRRLNEEGEEKYRSFIKESDKARIQHTLGFRDLINDTYRNAEPWYFVAGEDEIRASFPLFKMKSFLFGTEIVSQPFVDNGGFIGDIESDDIEALVEEIGDTPAEIRLNTFMPNYNQLESLLVEEGFEKHVLRQQFVKELYDPESMYEDFSDSTTRMVEEAEEKHGLVVKDIGGSKGIEEFYPLYASAMKHFGTPQHPISFFEQMWERLYPGRVKGFNCYYEGQAIAMMICYTVGNYCYFIYNVSDPEYLDKRPNDLLYWKVMKWAAENGYEYFDFGQVQAEADEGTHAAGLYHFKEKWGPELYDKPIFTLNKDLEDEEHERVKKMWRKVPKPVTDFFGPFLASRKAY